jgi:glycosyltransferase involved in cell wall biosynthesis
MPVYNTERYLAEAVESILGQTFGDFEFLIIDDGSTDRSREILERYATRDHRIRLTSRPNTGYVVALNEMLGLAQGELLARMDSDDVSRPDRFRLQVEYLERHPECLAVGSRALAIDPDGDPLAYWFPAQDHEEIDAVNLAGRQGSALCHPSVMMRRSAVINLGGYLVPYTTSEDLDLWLRLAEVGRLANLEEPLVNYRCHPTNIGYSQGTRQREAAAAAVADARRRRGLPPAELPAQAVPVAQSFNSLFGWMALGSGNIATARKHARAQLARRPFSSDSWKLAYCALRGR